MTIVTPGVLPASALAAEARPAWLDRWGAFAGACRFEDLAPEVVARAKLVLIDCIGAVAAGMREPEMQALVRRQPAVIGGAPAIGAGACFRPATAALLNGTAGTMLELDEGNQYARGHPGIHVAPAILAWASVRQASGRDLLLALALGYEIGARIGLASKLRVTMHPHGTWGTVGAALALARLEGAGAEEIIETVNVASTLGLATSRRTMLEGGTVRNVYAGVSNQLGFLARDLVASGFVGERDGVGTVYGTVIAEAFDPDAMTAELGRRWEIARNYFKRHAACRYTHGALDALQAILAEASPIDPEAVEALDVDTYVWAAQLDAAEPRNMLAAKFSLPFALATAIVTGSTGVEAFRDAARRDEATLRLARRVAVREDPALTALLPGLRPARLRLRLADGRELRAEALTNRGDTEDPYSAEEVGQKFRELAAPVFGAATADALIIAVDELDASDFDALDRLLRQPPQGGFS